MLRHQLKFRNYEIGLKTFSYPFIQWAYGFSFFDYCFIGCIVNFITNKEISNQFTISIK